METIQSIYDVDILLATYNGEKWLNVQLDSILRQTHSNFRLLISDDCSTDVTVSILNTYAQKDPRISVFSHTKNMGVIANFEFLVSQIQAPYFMFCDQDDQWAEEKIELMLKKIKEQKVSLIYHDLEIVDKNMQTLSPSFWKVLGAFNLRKRGTSWESIFNNNCITGCACILDSRIAKQLIPFPRIHQFYHDWWAGLIASNHNGIQPLNKKLAKYRQHGDNQIGAIQDWHKVSFRRFVKMISRAPETRHELLHDYHWKYEKIFLANRDRLTKIQVQRAEHGLQYLARVRKRKIFNPDLYSFFRIFWRENISQLIVLLFFFHLYPLVYAPYRIWFRKQHRCLLEKISTVKSTAPIPDSTYSRIESFLDQIYSIPSQKFRADEYTELIHDLPIQLEARDPKYLAFYLGQYHQVPENDAWWGRGFTEWTNVSKAVPQFIGHYQPHLPGELGFYDLTNIEVLHRQIDLARLYGIYGFCFYYYWFNKNCKLFKKTLNLYLEDQNDFPFCFCWANESWTRTWDGQEREILAKQKYELDEIDDFVTDILAFMKDRRYIRINGRPVLMIYRVDNIKERNKYIQRLLDVFAQHQEAPYIIAAEAFGINGCTNRPGIDAYSEFMMHTKYEPENITGHFDFINSQFKGRVLSYDAVVSQQCDIQKPEYPLYRCAATSWDNIARRSLDGWLFYGATPKKFEEWLYSISVDTIKNDLLPEKLVFIFAWNEWAEGAHLEPDRKYGYAFLNSIRNVLLRLKGKYLRS